MTSNAVHDLYNIRATKQVRISSSGGNKSACLGKFGQKRPRRRQALPACRSWQLRGCARAGRIRPRSLTCGWFYFAARAHRGAFRTRFVRGVGATGLVLRKLRA